MQSGSGAKNPPWARSNVNSNMTGLNPQIMDPNAMISQQGIMPFQQTSAVFNPNIMQTQGGMAMPMGSQMQMNQMAQGQMYPGNVVAYPTPRAMNPGMYQNAQSNQQTTNSEQRVFTGTVTKTHNDFGFVDHDVFYQTSVCAKGAIPKVNDRVLVEATYNPNMPFKWNATHVQVLNAPNQKSNPPKINSYNAVPPPAAKKLMPSRRDDRSPRREERPRPPMRPRSRSRSSERPNNRRDNRDNRTRKESPPRKRPAIVHQPSPVKQNVRVPRMPLEVEKLDVLALTQRYTNSLYIPSDFFSAHVKWGETFPPQAPFSLNNTCAYHVMSKETDNPVLNDAILEPPDADYRFSAKVMLISLPSLEALYQKCGLTKSDEKDKYSSKSPQHPTRLIKFLVGQKGKSSENFAIGGPWSPSMDGEDPQCDPKVLVKTAIRTCKALTGIDLSSCTQWYRMVEFYYWREGSGGKARLECVVLFLPDVWSAQPSRIEWGAVQEQYKAAYEAALDRLDGKSSPVEKQPRVSTPPDVNTSQPADQSKIEIKDADNSTITIDENDDDDDVIDKDPKAIEPTHYSKIDLKTIKLDQIKKELRARKISFRKGTRPQLLSRLSKLLKAEEDKELKGAEIMDLEDDEPESEISVVEKEETKTENEISKSEFKEPETKPEIKEPEKHIEVKDLEKAEKKDEENKAPVEQKEERKKTEKEIEEDKKKLEKEKQMLNTRYEIPTVPHIIVHPSATAKGGKFNCTIATLSLLLDYRITDNKEHSFELFVFAELFNEMLMRDFGFYVYKTLYTLPEKPEEVKEKSVETVDKKDDKKDEKKDDKRDEKRNSRKRERKDSHSDDDRSNSPKRRSRGVELPTDPFLLLALVYFDTARGGSMTKKDLQNLFVSLGLFLSRSQIRTVVEKVCVKDVFNYKTLIKQVKELGPGSSELLQDLPSESTEASDEVVQTAPKSEENITIGNRNLLPLFKESRPSSDGTSSGTVDVSETGMVTYKSRLVDVGALMAAEARGAGARLRLEQALAAAKEALSAARHAAASTQQAERGAKSQLTDLSASLAAARTRIASLTTSSKIFHSALKSIQAKVEAVVNIKYEDDDVVEVVNGPLKNKKGKDPKKTEDITKTEQVKKEVDMKKDETNKTVKPEPKQDETDTAKDLATKKEWIEKTDTTDEKSDSNKIEQVESEDAEDKSNTDIIKTENMDIDDKE
ncbi:hypothetical protein K1T71_005609 [Dendrolimus kikuchii]|uniref:Uncharacterized protein n=1 Tax=Dendrolimus kikuchii TaxID=765133 RepID=A0ACC1D4H6_9NEOP|nr:hypothetical protein K1T71_005609 [Dendrolimus kikuchii]